MHITPTQGAVLTSKTHTHKTSGSLFFNSWHTGWRKDAAAFVLQRMWDGLVLLFSITLPQHDLKQVSGPLYLCFQGLPGLPLNVM